MRTFYKSAAYLFILMICTSCIRSVLEYYADPMKREHPKCVLRVYNHSDRTIVVRGNFKFLAGTKGHDDLNLDEWEVFVYSNEPHPAGTYFVPDPSNPFSNYEEFVRAFYSNHNQKKIFWLRICDSNNTENVLAEWKLEDCPVKEVDAQYWDEGKVVYFNMEYREEQ